MGRGGLGRLAALGLLVLLAVIPHANPHPGSGPGPREGGHAPRGWDRVRWGALRLRGGALRSREREGIGAKEKGRQTQEMELDREEAEDAVKTGLGETRSGALVLEGAEPREEAGNPVRRTKLGIDEPIPKLHAHANKVVRERPKALRLGGRRAEEDPRLFLDAKIAKRDGEQVLKKASINCTLATEHGLFNVTEFAEYLGSRIKVNGQMGDRQTAVRVVLDGDTIVVTSAHATQLKRHRTWSRKLSLADSFSTRYLKYLTKKFICKQELRDVVRCVSTDFSLASRARGGPGQRLEIRYTNIWRQRALRIKVGQKVGTRMEAARREMLTGQFRDDDDKLQINRPEQLWERKIKATGERVGGMDYLEATRKTVAETVAGQKELLKHWVALQKRTYRAPFGGQFRGFTDQSILRHDPDRVGKKGGAHSTAGYSAPRTTRGYTGTREGLESMMYTGTAPNGFRNNRKQMVAQKLEQKQQVSRYRAQKGYSRQGDADRTIYNWKPKWLFSGKMDLHKRDRR